jgi:hypothetical protein
MQGRCDKHLFETATDVCQQCGHEFCPDCLVYSFGPKKPPFCVPCAVAAAGIRHNAGVTPLVSRRDMKRLVKERRKALRRTRAEEPAPAPAHFTWAEPSTGTAS